MNEVRTSPCQVVLKNISTMDALGGTLEELIIRKFKESIDYKEQEVLVSGSENKLQEKLDKLSAGSRITRDSQKKLKEMVLQYDSKKNGYSPNSSPSIPSMKNLTQIQNGYYTMSLEEVALSSECSIGEDSDVLGSIENTILVGPTNDATSVSVKQTPSKKRKYEKTHQTEDKVKKQRRSPRFFPICDKEPMITLENSKTIRDENVIIENESEEVILEKCKTKIQKRKLSRLSLDIVVPDQDDESILDENAINQKESEEVILKNKKIKVQKRKSSRLSLQLNFSTTPIQETPKKINFEHNYQTEDDLKEPRRSPRFLPKGEHNYTPALIQETPLRKVICQQDYQREVKENNKSTFSLKSNLRKEEPNISRRSLRLSLEPKTQPKVDGINIVNQVKPVKDSEALIQSSPKKVVSQEEKSRWQPGDIIWSRVSTKSQYWPSIVVQDPNEKYTLLRHVGRSQKLFVHVRYLDDKGQEAYVMEDDTYIYKGFAEFERMEVEVNVNHKKIKQSPPKKPNGRRSSLSWLKSIEEADNLMDLNVQRRIEEIKTKYLKPITHNKTSEIIEDPEAEITKKPRKSHQEKGPRKSQTPEMLDKGNKKRNSTPKVDKKKSIGRNSIKPEKIDLFSSAKDDLVCSLCYTYNNTAVLQCTCCYTPFHKQCMLLKTNKVEEEPKKKTKKMGKKQKRKEMKYGRFSLPAVNEWEDDDVIPLAQVGEKEKEILDINNWKCSNCQQKKNACFVCHTVTGVRRRCHVGNCGKFYHIQCLRKYYPQTKYNAGELLNDGKYYKQCDVEVEDDGEEDSKDQILSCPLHTCHTCASSDPKEDHHSNANERLVQCVECPSTYHCDKYCIPAGSQILSKKQIKCGRHYEQKKNAHKVKAGNCLICMEKKESSPICCQMCPTTYHRECLPNLTNPDVLDTGICEECESGRFPLYCDVVWAKLGNHRFWPAKVLFPGEVPLPRNYVFGQFAVRFYGTNDYNWLDRSRMYMFHEDDPNFKNKANNNKGIIMNKAIDEAGEDKKLFKQIRDSVERKLLKKQKPPGYTKIRTNHYVGNTRQIAVNLDDHICDCHSDQESPCGPDSNCLNRRTLIECNPRRCNAGNLCCNQRFGKRTYPPLATIKTDTRGWGLKCKRDLNEGEFIIEYVGEVIDKAECDRRIQRKHDVKDKNFYFLTMDKERIIDAGPKGNLARFLNHSCAPNCETQKWTVNGCLRIGIFAICDIPAGTELTFDYYQENSGSSIQACNCGAINCVGFMGSKPSALSKKTEPVYKKKKSSDDICFICGFGGKVMICDSNYCSKVYHLECLKLKEWPKSTWICPRHLCIICNQGTRNTCKKCPIAYCSLHLKNNLKPSLNNGFLCLNHTPMVKNNHRRKSVYLKRVKGGIFKAEEIEIYTDVDGFICGSYTY